MKNRGKVFKKMVLSYIAVLCIPLVISILMYNITYGIMRRQANLYNDNLAETLKSSCDGEVRYYRSFLNQLRIDSTLQEISGKIDYSASDLWNIHLTRQKLSDLKNSVRDDSFYCYNIFVWMRKTDMVLDQTTFLPYNMYCHYMDNENEEEMELLKNAMEQCTDGTAIGLTNKSLNYVLFLEPVIGMGVEKGDVIAGIWVNLDAFNARVNSVRWEGGMEWALLDGQNRILRSPSNIDVKPEDLETLSDLGGEISVDGTDYLINVQPSDFFGLKYLLFMPKNLVDSPVNQIRLFSLVSLFVMLGAGFFAASFFARMHYGPLKNLLSLFSGAKTELKEKGIENEYEYLERKTSAAIANSQKSEKKRKELERSYTLERMLTVPGTDENPEDSCADIYDKFREGKNVVLVCGEKKQEQTVQKNHAGEQEQTVQESQLIEESQLRRYIVANVFDEGIGQYFEQETFEVWDKVVVILNVPEEQTDYAAKLQEEVERLREFITRNFKFAFYTLQGSAHEGIRGIRQSWQEACQTEEFAANPDEMYVRYDEIKDLSVYGYGYSFDVEERVINAIREGNVKLALFNIDSVLENYFGKSENSISEMQTLMLYDIFGTLVKVSEEQGISVGLMPRLNFMSGENTAESMKKYFHGLVEDICLRIEQKNKTNDRELYLEVREYIQTHYMDPDLNISQIAYQFHMTPSLLSSTFRKKTGKGILTEIKEVRMEKAKSLLQEGRGVYEVGQMVGFREDTSFIRMFKSYTGITPGQLKKMNKK